MGSKQKKGTEVIMKSTMKWSGKALTLLTLGVCLASSLPAYPQQTSPPKPEPPDPCIVRPHKPPKPQGNRAVAQYQGPGPDQGEV
jgi:hypothetical protein